MDPRHSLDKLKALRKDTYLTQTFDVFDPVTGAYDKKVRDAEPIGNMDRYLEAYPVFANYPEATNTTNEEAITGTLESLTRIRDLCQENGINLIVLCAPVYADYMDYFSWDQVADFYTRLAQVTPYWDFSYSSVSFEPRYFYDETHFRNCVGEMALARIFGDDSLYIPDDFGVYVTSDNVQEHLADMAQAAPLAAQSYTAEVPVLMYHHIDQEGNDSTAMTPALFEAQIAALAQAGYTAVFPDDLAAYVNQGKALPDKPIVITFDDGYLSNYEYAWPILEKYGMVATIFMVGATTGNTEHYKDTAYPITPHFSYEQGAEMVASGVISLQSHTYDMHQWGPYESTDQPRETILPLEGESEADYRASLSADCQKIRQAIQNGTGEENVHVIAYPSGRYNSLAQVTLLENDDTPFVMELPPYRMPTAKSIFRHTWEKGAQYLKKMGGIIMVASVIIWFLGYYPNHDAYETVAEQQENSYIGQLGRAIEPVIEPMGFDWKLGIGLISGVGAKELVVSTLGVLYVDDPDADSVSLAERIPITPLVAFCYMLFVLIYFPCIAALAAIKQESGSWKWALFAACYTTVLAWLVSFAVYQIGGLFV